MEIYDTSAVFNVRSVISMILSFYNSNSPRIIINVCMRAETIIQCFSIRSC